MEPKMVESVKPRGIGEMSAPTRDAGKAPDGGFTVGGGAEAPQQKARVSSAGALGLETMLSLQGVDPPRERDREARRRGAAMIAALTALQRAMLTGGDTGDALRTLNDAAAADQTADDPALRDILRAIILRSRVEMARRERESGPARES
jgi:hypothetical protein